MIIENLPSSCPDLSVAIDSRRVDARESPGMRFSSSFGGTRRRRGARKGDRKLGCSGGCLT